MVRGTSSSPLRRRSRDGTEPPGSDRGRIRRRPPRGRRSSSGASAAIVRPSAASALHLEHAERGPAPRTRRRTPRGSPAGIVARSIFDAPGRRGRGPTAMCTSSTCPGRQVRTSQKPRGRAVRPLSHWAPDGPPCAPHFDRATLRAEVGPSIPAPSLDARGAREVEIPRARELGGGAKRRDRGRSGVALGAGDRNAVSRAVAPRPFEAAFVAAG